MFVSMPPFSLMRREWSMCSSTRSVTDSLYQCYGRFVPMWRDFFLFSSGIYYFLPTWRDFFTIVMKDKYHYDGIIFPVPKCLFTNVQECQCTSVPRPPFMFVPSQTWRRNKHHMTEKTLKNAAAWLTLESRIFAAWLNGEDGGRRRRRLTFICHTLERKTKIRDTKFFGRPPFHLPNFRSILIDFPSCFFFSGGRRRRRKLREDV